MFYLFLASSHFHCHQAGVDPRLYQPFFNNARELPFTEKEKQQQQQQQKNERHSGTILKVNNLNYLEC